MAGMSLLLLAAGIICMTSSYITSATPLITGNLCAAPCVARCSPQCSPSCCVGNAVPPPCAQRKPEYVISSVDEGETEECGDKGFNSPTDNSEDPPGTVTIPLPPTMYTPPKPGEPPRELPMPDFKLPASILQGKMPSQSITLTPEPAKGESPPNTLMSITPPKLVAPAPPAPPPAPPPPPPPPPVRAPASGGYAQFPKLPPVTVSEIPGRASRYPPLPKMQTAHPAPLPPLMINSPKPPPVHIAVGSPAAMPLGVSAAGPSVATAGITTGTCVSPPCTNRPMIDPVAKELANELNSRYGQ